MYTLIAIILISRETHFRLSIGTQCVIIIIIIACMSRESQGTNILSSCHKCSCGQPSNVSQYS